MSRPYANSNGYLLYIMKTENNKKRIAILGGGPSGMFMYKRLTEAGNTNIIIDIFERKQQLGAGMPYSQEGASHEHITNVSANEIPKIVTSIHEWVFTQPKELLDKYNIVPENFNDYKVLPRLLFGKYLSDQFELLLDNANNAGIFTNLHLGSNVVDIIDKPEQDEVWVEVENSGIIKFDQLIICTGHNWPKKHEGKVPGYFDSPYPPAKIALKLNHKVAIKGSSLTAVDAIRTLARSNGTFSEDSHGRISYKLADDSKGFKMMMHSRSGLLPAVRFHLEDTHLQNDSLLTPEDIEEHKAKNNGFLSLDFIFDKDFKEPLKDKQPDFYDNIKDLSIEEFVDAMMDLRERLEPFQLLKAEYAEAEKSIKRHQSVYWKEMLAVLSFAMNYPAKYLSAEDMLRLQKTLMPLISIVIAFVPQRSCEELLALHNEGLLDIVAVGHDSEIVIEDEGGITYKYTDEDNNQQKVYYKTFVDCVGQPHLSYKDFPFNSLLKDKVISPAKLQFRNTYKGEETLENGNDKVEQGSDRNYYLNVPGITINDNFQVIDNFGAYNQRIFIMAVPYIGGYNPDYSGLDFSEEASGRIVKTIFKNSHDTVLTAELSKEE